MAYAAIQVTTGERRRSRVTKAMAGHFAKANAGSGRGLWEFRVDEVGEVELGGELSVEQFKAGQIVEYKALQRVRATPERSSAGTFAAKTIPTATRSLTAHRGPLDNARRQGAYLKAKKCLATWALLESPPRIWKSFA